MTIKPSTKCLQLNKHPAFENIRIMDLKIYISTSIVDLDGALTGETVNLDIIQDIVGKFNFED